MPNVLLRVYLMDDTHKTVYVDPETTTIESLWNIMSQKLLLTSESAECFFIWAISQDVELLLYSDMTVQDVYDEWSEIEDKYSVKKSLVSSMATLRSPKNMTRSPSKVNLSRSPSTALGQPPTTAPAGLQRAKSAMGLAKTKSVGRSTGFGVSAGLADAETEAFKLVFRPTAVLSLAAERSLIQPEAVHLLYIQAVHHVIQSNYPCTKDAAVLLGGVQLQIALGDQKADHMQHFNESLERYIPEHLRAQRKAEEWMTDLIAAHQTHRGKDANTLKRQYIDTVQRFPFYGSTFFKAKYIPAVTSFYKQDYQGTVSLGLNHTGIHIIDPKLMKFETWGFRNLVFWDSLHNTFVFEAVTNSKQNPTRRCTFKTPQAELINDLMFDWSEEWEEEVTQEEKSKNGAEGGRERSFTRERENEKLARKERRNTRNSRKIALQ